MYVNRKEKVLGYGEAMKLAKEKWGDMVVAIGSRRDLRKIKKLNIVTEDKEERRRIESQYRLVDLAYIGEVHWFDNDIFTDLGLLECENEIGYQPYTYIDFRSKFVDDIFHVDDVFNDIYTSHWVVLLFDPTQEAYRKSLTKEEVKDLLSQTNNGHFYL